MTETYLYQRQTNKQSDYNVWLAFPECYSFSLSSIGYLWLFKELDEDINITAERITTDTEKTQIKPDEVDAVGFSFTFDLDFINIFKILEKYDIPLKSSERDNKHPVVFGGGAVLTANPELYKEFFDFIIVGDGEGVNKNVLMTIKKYPKWILKDKKWCINKEFYNQLSKINGVYVPQIHNASNPAKKSTVKSEECIYTSILSKESFFSDTFIIEISRGCSNCCGFCLASYLNLPVRFVDYETIIKKIELGLKYTNKIALLGALVSAHPRFEDICKYVLSKIESGIPVEMSISSMRANTLSPDIIKTLVAAGQKNITIAIEAATERLRKVVNKNITEQEIFNAVRLSKENGLNGIKIYSMLGLPTETEEDVKEFIRLANDLKKEFKGFDIVFSFSTFVPKLHTPLQYSARESTKSLEKKIKYLQKEFHKLGVSARFSSPKWDYYQTLLSRGDSSLTDYIIEVYKLGGKLGAFKSAAKKTRIDTDKYVIQHMHPDDISHGNVVEIVPGKDRLIKEYERLMKIS